MAAKKSARINLDGCEVRIIHFNRVSAARDKIIPDRDIEKMALIYKVLGDPTRLKIVMALADGEMCVCDIAAFLCMSESAVSHQLRRLYDSSLVKKRREGQCLYYNLDDTHVADLLKTGLAHATEGNVS